MTKEVNYTTEGKELVSMELAKKLKEHGYSKPTKFFYQMENLPFSEKGIKHCKGDEVLNHNDYGDVICSAPELSEGTAWLHGKVIAYESSITLELGKEPMVEVPRDIMEALHVIMCGGRLPDEVYDNARAPMERARDWAVQWGEDRTFTDWLNTQIKNNG